jgi:hypothetical protein
MANRYVAFSLILLLAGCSGVSVDPRLRSIDQVPMYGGFDRSIIPELQKADEAFIESTASAFGGRKRASKVWVDQGFVHYKRDELDMAMRRFNQAWLLDPENPEVYWGFGSVMHDRGFAFGAYNMQMRAYKLGFRDAGFLADLGRVAALRTIEVSDLSPEERSSYLAESDSFYAQAVVSGEDLAYVYDSWSSVNYLIGNYSVAWEKLKTARVYGGGVNAEFVEALVQKMPEPR